MSLISQVHRGVLLSQRNLIFNQKRFTVRESIHRHVEPHKDKKHMLSACEPYIKRTYLSQEETCRAKIPKIIEMHPLERILVDELLGDIKHSNFILFIQYNYTKFQSDRVYKNTIIKSGGKFHALNNNVYRETFKILNREDICPLFIARNALITGQSDKLTACINALKKMPQYILLAGMIDHHLYELDQLRSIAAAANLDQARANLLSVLTTPSIDLSSHLQQHFEANSNQDNTKDKDSG